MTTRAAYRFRAPPTVPLSQQGGAWMCSTRSEVAPEGTYHLAINMVPVNPENPHSVLHQRRATRPLWDNVTTSTGTPITAGLLFDATGEAIRWLLTTTGLWVVNASGTYSNTVTAANFGSKGCLSYLSGTDRVYATVFNNRVVLNLNLTNVNPLSYCEPCTWDGTPGAGGLTRLVNAGLCYGRPTVRSAKLFFIRWFTRDTLVWSEEDDATTGYDAGGFSNIWTLNQTGTAPLYAILGTNDGLYYFRQRSTGVIRGEVNSDFVTSSTHDALSQTIGTVLTDAVEFANGAIWFVDQNGSPRWIPSGGYPRQVLPEDTVPLIGTGPDPLDIVDLGTAYTGATGLLSVPPLSWAPYETIWVLYPSTTQPSAIVALVCHAASGRPLAWITTQGNNGAHMVVSLDVGGTPCVLYYGNIFVGFTGIHCADTDVLGATQATDYVVVGAPLGTSAWARSRFSRFALLGGGDVSYQVSVNLATSDDPTASAAPILLDAAAPQDGRRTCVFNRTGRWARPVLWTTLDDATVDVRVTYDGWSLLATPFSAGPTAP